MRKEGPQGIVASLFHAPSWPASRRRHRGLLPAAAAVASCCLGVVSLLPATYTSEIPAIGGYWTCIAIEWVRDLLPLASHHILLCDLEEKYNPAIYKTKFSIGNTWSTFCRLSRPGTIHDSMNGCRNFFYDMMAWCSLFQGCVMPLKRVPCSKRIGWFIIRWRWLRDILSSNCAYLFQCQKKSWWLCPWP